MRANYKLRRLFVMQSLSEDVRIAADRAQSHYLLHVLRMESGRELLVFNGRDGEWRARIEIPSRKAVTLVPVRRERPQPEAADLVFCFAPIKAGRLDWLVEKAVEMGAGAIQPVITDFTQNARLNSGKMESWIIEAATQCGVLAVPELRPVVRLDSLLEGWPEDRALIFCDEDRGTDNPAPALSAVRHDHLGVLIGPEGGFSDDERERLRALPFVTAIPLGPRILRADTAAVAALTAVQMLLGDWQHQGRGAASLSRSEDPPPGAP
ncbi:16S rRNA (uracil(1498)-N(3))-methyltransferase [Pseudohoeflea coraliihabitans]|uniref:Ribosomal RNA small subunit methyltransferase E n=1 Tax=Pseudohoeflea coraliihabitans TaxID=2860393 RepID=A0ABS6WMF6_9HYPH|nr:16S rRNA (uracil(1498)-N(3))-methyltransferase [Pseudohoeflea sp. DP4N28-3]MBW3097126.1 16S rRNA (uracil(1498)-N(3))-methyltransferase [Pseudohoeflea sp. DP4N28-3]